MKRLPSKRWQALGSQGASFPSMEDQGGDVPAEAGGWRLEAGGKAEAEAEAEADDVDLLVLRDPRTLDPLDILDPLDSPHDGKNGPSFQHRSIENSANSLEGINRDNCLDTTDRFMPAAFRIYRRQSASRRGKIMSNPMGR